MEIVVLKKYYKSTGCLKYRIVVSTALVLMVTMWS